MTADFIVRTFWSAAARRRFGQRHRLVDEYSAHRVCTGAAVLSPRFFVPFRVI
ncbi:MAG: hypothetical protein AABN95_18660 [Acidobacteriota bacterium]